MEPSELLLGAGRADDDEPTPDCAPRPGVPLASGFENGRPVKGLSLEAKARIRRAWEEFDRAQRIVARDGRNHVIG